MKMFLFWYALTGVVFSSTLFFKKYQKDDNYKDLIITNVFLSLLWPIFVLMLLKGDL